MKFSQWNFCEQPENWLCTIAPMLPLGWPAHSSVKWDHAVGCHPGGCWVLSREQQSESLSIKHLPTLLPQQPHCRRRSRWVTTGGKDCEEKEGAAWETTVTCLAKAVLLIIYSYLTISVYFNRCYNEMKSLIYFLWVICTYPLNTHYKK